MTTKANIFGIDSSRVGPFKAALVLGKGLPTEIDGQPVTYWWKEMLPVGQFDDVKKKPSPVDAKRIDTIVECFSRAKAKGYKAFLPFGSHNARDKNLGWLIDVRKNDKGVLEGLHQVIGEDARLEVSRNGSSICTLKDVTDEQGEHYAELIDHNAILPDPKAFTLGDFIPFNPALAASRGQTIGAEYFSLAAPSQESTMDIAALRKAVGAADTVPDADVINQAVAKLGTIPALTQDRDTLKTDKQSLETKVTELSRSSGGNKPAAPDPEVLRDRADITVDRINVAVDKGEMPRAFADKLIGKVKPGDKPSAFMLSRQDDLGDRPADFVLSLFKGEKFGVKTGEETGSQSADPIELSRQPSEGGRGAGGGYDPKKAVEDGKKQGEEYAKQRLAERQAVGASR